MPKLKLSISGMTCGGCVKATRRALERVAGVSVESVSIGSAVVHLERADARNDVIRVIEDAGFHVDAAQET